MSHEMVDGVLHFNCDSKGCHKNFECDAGEFRAGWAEAKAHGWVNSCSYKGNISTWLNFCPKCARELGDD
jgi:hypothetical protein